MPVTTFAELFGANFPTADEMLVGAQAGVSGSLVDGTVVLPLEVDVRGDVTYGANAALVGTMLTTGGTDWTADERAAIRAILGIPASGTVPTSPSVGALAAIADKANNLPELPAMLTAIGQQDHRPYDQDEGSIGWTARKLQSGASPGIPRAF